MNAPRHSTFSAAAAPQVNRPSEVAGSVGNGAAASPEPTVNRGVELSGDAAASINSVVDENGIPTHPTYRKLFGLIPPDQVFIRTEPSEVVREGEEAPSPSREGARVATTRQRAVAAAAEPFFLRPGGSIDSIAECRERHIAKGHTPEADCAHGSAFFTQGCRHFLSKAMSARTGRNRRKHMVAAAAMIAALIDRDDHSQQEETHEAQPEQAS